MTLIHVATSVFVVIAVLGSYGVDYCSTASADSKNAVNSLFTVAPRAGMMT